MSEEGTSGPVSPGAGRKRNWLEETRFLLKNGPLAILASSLPGFVNYFIIIYLTYQSGAAEAGTYRLIMSYFALAGLVSMQESSKVFIRSTATNDRETFATIFLLRVVACLLTLLAACAALVLARQGVIDIPPSGLIAVVLISTFFYPFDLFNAYFQARGRFMMMSLAALAKYTFAFAVFMVAMFLGATTTQAALMQLAVMALFHIVFFAIWIGRDVLAALRRSFHPIARLKSPASRESMVLSLANILPGSLEHVDKIVIGAVFGLEALGLYTLGFSTGRFLYNALKPALYVYYARFVHRMPTGRLLWFVMGSFTVFGVALTGGFLWAVDNLAFMHKFEGTRIVTAIMFLSYGIAMVDAVYLQAYAINKDTNSRHLLVANTLSSLACLLMFAAATQTTVLTAMIICALHYPLRHAATIAIVSWLRQRETSRRTGTVVA